MNTPYTGQKPGLFNAIAVMTLVNGIVNLVWGYVASATALGTIIGVVCLPITILPTILGVFEIIYAAKLLSSQPQAVQPSPSIAVFQITMILYGNLFSMIVGIVNLIFFKDQAVMNYFASLNNTMAFSPAVQSSETKSLSVPAVPELPNPSAAEEPAKPKK